MTHRRGTIRVGCDIGGTFTDFVLFDTATRAIRIEKCLTTPRDPAAGVMRGLGSLATQAPGYLQEIEQIAHASTLVANAVIERKGAKCALLCTKGFRDLLEVRRHVRVTTYELWTDPPEPLVPRHLRIPVTERTLSDGTILAPVSADEIRSIAEYLRNEGVESIAIAFLHSYKNPANEAAASRQLASLLPGIPISISSLVLPQIKEYERTSTTVVNAYVRPLVQHYLTQLASRLDSAGVKAPLHIMMSNGGIGAPEVASAYPIRLIESGPVAGAKVAQYYGNLCGIQDVLAFDMGGTTAKGCLIRNGEIPITNELEVARSQRFIKSSGYPISVPGAHLIEIGAGGGSIASLNAVGLLQVGPQSAAAEPGPACYGIGGTEPTVTDADLVLGYLNAENFVGGAMKLDPGLAREAIVERVANPLGRPLLAAAWSIHDVINETMAAAIRMHATEHGGRIDGVTLIAFGGAGPVHAYALARKLRIRKICVPLRPGVLSAVGLLIAPPAYDIVKTFRVGLTSLDPEELEREYLAIEKDIERVLRAVQPDGQVTFQRSADLAYVGQGYQVSVPTHDLGSRIEGGMLWRRFAEIYREKYGYFYEDVPGELVALRVGGHIRGGQFEPEKLQPSEAKTIPRAKTTRLAYSQPTHSMVEFAVYDRAELRPGMRFDGPALVEEDSSTTVIDVAGSAEVDDYGSLFIVVPVVESKQPLAPVRAGEKEVRA